MERPKSKGLLLAFGIVGGVLLLGVCLIGGCIGLFWIGKSDRPPSDRPTAMASKPDDKLTPPVAVEGPQVPPKAKPPEEKISVLVLRDDPRIVANSQGTPVRRQPDRVLTAALLSLNAIAVSPDGSKVAACSQVGPPTKLLGPPSKPAVVAVWDAGTGVAEFTREVRTADGQMCRCNNVRFDSAPNTVWIMYEEDTGFNLQLRRGIWSVDYKGGTFTPRSGGYAEAVSPDDRFVYTSFLERLELQAKDKGTIVRGFRAAGETRSVGSITADPRGELVAACYRDYSAADASKRRPDVLRVFAVETGRQQVQIDTDGHSAIVDLVFDKTGRALHALTASGLVHTWNRETGELTARCRIDPPAAFGECFLLPDGKRLVSKAKGGLVQLWDIETGRKLETFDPGAKRDVTRSDVSANGELLAIGCVTGEALLYRLK